MALCAKTALVQQRLTGKVQKQSRVARVAPVRALSDVNLVVGGCTIGALCLGRFGVLPLHRQFLAKAGMPKQDGKTHKEAGDRFSEELTLVTKTNDPAGFTIVDVAAWGALGHAAAFYLLATHSLTVDRTPF